MAPPATDSIGRFTSRVESYARHRPRYPQGAVDYLAALGALPPGATVADVGAGTGILTALLLENGYTVFAVEPNAAMRGAAAAVLAGDPRFHAVDGTAEATALPANSVDAVTAAQAFHWFSPAAARTEFQRMLKPGGWVALLWNDRRVEASPFMAAYEALVDRVGTDFRQVCHTHVVDDALLHGFFGPEGFARHELPNDQVLDWEGLLGRATSTSYLPGPGTEGYDSLATQLRQLFERYASDGEVVMVYTTRIYAGRLR